jgi:glycosyltransferase involved in cell wall biosynthesis
MSPFFSICIPAYNAGKFLSATIESVLCQSFTDFELVLLDNASTDNTELLISLYPDSRIRVIRNMATVPAHENWTRAISQAEGAWIKLVCADDLLKPNALQKIHDDLMQHPEVLVHAGNRDVIDEAGKIVRLGKSRYSDGAILSLANVVDRVLSSGSNPLGESICLTWKSDLSEQVGPFSKHWKYFIDLDYWLRLSKTSLIYYTTEVLGSFRVSQGSWTSSIGFRTTREAKDFFFSHEEFAPYSRLLKYRAVSQAGLRTIARQVFLMVVLRRSQPKLSHKNGKS